MIKINLLGNDTALDNSGKIILASSIIGIFFTIVLFILVITQLSANQANLTLETKTLEGKLENLTLKTKSVEDLEKNKKALQSKLVVIAELRKSIGGPVRVLDDLNLATGDKVWLAEIQEQNLQMKIRGRAITNQDIASFISKLEESDYFEDVNLIESRSMYYDKKTGVIKASRDLAQVALGTSTIGSSKVNKETQSSNVVNRNDSSKDDINIKEFILSSKIKYGGNLKAKEEEEKKVEVKDKKEVKSKETKEGI